MATVQKTKLLIWITALALVMACAPALTIPATQAVVNPGAINTFIVQTANAAATQTAAALPSATFTPNITPTSNTETPTSTITATVVYVFFSPTAPVLPPLNLVSSSDNYACHVTKTSPPNGSTMEARQDFDVFWTVQNAGKQQWDRGSVDYIYSSGAKMHIISTYELGKNVAAGGTIEVGVDMRAPKTAGTYTTTWTMRSGSRTFCPLTITIIVKETSQ